MKYVVSTNTSYQRKSPLHFAVSDIGERYGRTILAVPGLGLTAEMFTSCFAELTGLWRAEPLRLIGVNRPGLESPPSVGLTPVGLIDVARMHLDVADALGLDTFDLVGHSFGGPVVLKIAELAPARIRTIFIIDGAVYGAFLPSEFDGKPNAGVLKIDPERFAAEFGNVRPTGHPTGIAIKGDKTWPVLPDDPHGGWRTFSKIWRRSYQQIIAPYLGALLIQTSLGHRMHDPRPEDLGLGRRIRGNPSAIAQIHAAILRAHDHPARRIEVPPFALRAARAKIVYDPTHHRAAGPLQTLAALRKFRGAYLPRQRTPHTTPLTSMRQPHEAMG